METINGYVGILENKHYEVSGLDLSLYDAKCKIIAENKIPKSKQGMLFVMLAEKNGKQVVHTPC